MSFFTMLLTLALSSGPHRPRILHSHARPVRLQPIVMTASMGEIEARVDVCDAGAKGMGVFAAEQLIAGRWVGSYRGELKTQREVNEWYRSLAADDPSVDSQEYVFAIDSEYVLEAISSTHFSRYLNHAEHGSLVSEVDEVAKTVDFFAARDIAIGEELTFDYGYLYWRNRSAPSPETDSRNYSDPYYSVRPPGLTLLHPPPVGTVLPLTPLNAEELRASLMLPTAQCRLALLRCAEYFGATRAADGAIVLPVGDPISGEWSEPINTDELTLARLQRAATESIAYATLEGAAEAEKLLIWLEMSDAELGLIRSWRGRMPRLATSRHDAAALAAYLLWKNPAAHQVDVELPREESNQMIALAVGSGGIEMRGGSDEPLGSDAPNGVGEAYEVEVVERIICALAQHAPESHVRDLVATLANAFTIGDGCVVTSHTPPTLEGGKQEQLWRWDRVDELVAAGHLPPGS